MVEITRTEDGMNNIKVSNEEFIFILAYLGVANEHSDNQIKTGGNCFSIYHEMTNYGRENHLFGYDSTLFLNGWSLNKNGEI